MRTTEDSRPEPMSGAANVATTGVHAKVVAPSKPRVAAEQLSERFRPQAGVTAARAAGATVLLDVRRGLYHTLNQPAGRLWDVIESGEATLATLVDVLHAEHHDVPLEIVTHDVTHLLETLLESALITADPVCNDRVAGKRRSQ